MLTMEAGVGTIAGLDPQIKMEYSDDQGGIFDIAGLRSYGKIGERTRIPAWRRQGQVQRDRVLRFTTTEPIKSTLIRLDAEFSTSSDQPQI